MNELLKRAKNRKAASFVVILSIITTIFGVVQSNAEILGISSKTIMIVSLVITTIKLVYDQFFTEQYTANEMLDFTRYHRRNQNNRELVHKQDIDLWKRFR